MSTQFISVKNIILVGIAITGGVIGGYYLASTSSHQPANTTQHKDFTQNMKLAGSPRLPSQSQEISLSQTNTPPKEQKISSVSPQSSPEQLKQFWSECHHQSAKKRLHGCKRLINHTNLDAEGQKAAKTNLAYAQLELEQFEPAIQSFSELLKLYPKDIDLIGSRADTYQMMEKYDLATKDYSTALAMSKNRAVFLAGRAWAYFGQNNIKQALKDISKAIKKEKREASHYLTRGQFYEASHQPRKAMADYRKALRLNSRLKGAKEAIKRLKLSRKSHRR